jgi:hypothetical protein
MAQTKTRASTKRSQNQGRSRGAKKPQARTRSSNRKPPNRKPPKSRSQTARKTVESARETIESSTKEAGQAVGKAASRARTPLLAGGAALAGAAGGLALGKMRSHHSGSREMLGLKVPKARRPKLRSDDVARAARGVGSLSRHVGELATELGNDEGPKRNGRHKSPVEVVLDGLTARR